MVIVCEVLVEELDADVEVEVLVTSENVYMSSLDPPPQYSSKLPSHKSLQLDVVVTTDPAPSVLPQ